MNQLLAPLFRPAASAAFVEFAAHLWSRLAVGLWVGWAGLLVYAAWVAWRAR